MKHFIIWDDTNTGFKPGGVFSTEYVPTLRAGRFGIKVIETDKCILVGTLNNGVYEKMHEMSKRVYSQEGISPTIHTMGGGNLEPKVLIPQATKQGNIECQFGGGGGLGFP